MREFDKAWTIASEVSNWLCGQLGAWQEPADGDTDGANFDDADATEHLRRYAFWQNVTALMVCATSD
jgi:hypothetical protein